MVVNINSFFFKLLIVLVFVSFQISRILVLEELELVILERRIINSLGGTPKQ